VHEASTYARSSRRSASVTDRRISSFSRREKTRRAREAIEFYEHPHNWSNRLIADDSLLVMNSFLGEKRPFRIRSVVRIVRCSFTNIDWIF
jgi:hypothetical protein